MNWLENRRDNSGDARQVCNWAYRNAWKGTPRPCRWASEGSPLVTPTGVRDAWQRAMDLSGVPTAPPAGVGVAPNVSSPSSGVPSVTTIRAAAQDLPSPTFSPRQIDVMERILRNGLPEDQIDALLDSVGLDNNQLADYIAQRPPSPPPLLAVKAAAAGAISGGVGYGVKKALDRRGRR